MPTPRCRCPPAWRPTSWWTSSATTAEAPELRREEVGADLGEAFEVVHVGFEERHPHHRRRVHLLGQPGEVLLLAAGHQREVGQVVVEATEVGAGQGLGP